MDREKLKNGGMYLVDLTGNVNPEFGMKHYCVLIKTDDSELFLAIPTTTSYGRVTEKHYILECDKSIALYKHTRIISNKRVIGEKKIHGELCVLEKEDLDELLNGYELYIQGLHKKALNSVQQYHKAKEISKSKMKLECLNEATVYKDEDIDVRMLVPLYDGGKLLHDPISTKKIGTFEFDVWVKDNYSQKLKDKITLHVI